MLNSADFAGLDEAEVTFFRRGDYRFSRFEFFQLQTSLSSWGATNKSTTTPKLTLSLDKAFVMGGQDTLLLAIPWLPLSRERLLEYCKLAALKTDPSVDLQQARALQVRFLVQAPELKAVLMNSATLSTDRFPKYTALIALLCKSSGRQCPNVFASQMEPKAAEEPSTFALNSQAEISQDLTALQTRGATIEQLRHNRFLQRIKPATESKHYFVPEGHTQCFAHSAPEKSRPGIQNSRTTILVKDFREVLHKLADLPLDKKDQPAVWYSILNRMNKLSGVSKAGLKERDALLLPHALSFVMKMTFNLVSLLDRLSELDNEGKFSVAAECAKEVKSLLTNFQFSRSLLGQFETEFDEFFHAPTWANLSLSAKREKVAEFYHHFCLTTAPAPKIWTKGAYAPFMHTTTAQHWDNYFKRLARSSSKLPDSEPRAVFQVKSTTPPRQQSNRRRFRNSKGVRTQSLTNFNQGKQRGRGRGRQTRIPKRQQRRGKGRGRDSQAKGAPQATPKPKRGGE